MRLRGRTPRAKNNGFVDITTLNISSSEDDNDELAPAKRKLRKGRLSMLAKGERSGRTSRSRSHLSDPIELTTSDEDSEDTAKKRRGRKKKVLEPTRRSTRQPLPVQLYGDEESEESEDDSDDSDDILRSDVLPGGKRKRRGLRVQKSEKIQRFGTRQSERSTRATNHMGEANVNDIYRSDSAPKTTTLQVKAVKEVFETLPRSDLFRARHAEGCEALDLL